MSGVSRHRVSGISRHRDGVTATRIHPTTLLNTASETVRRTAAQPGGPKSPRHRDARSERRRTRKQEGHAGALSFSLRRDDLPITCLTCGPGRGARSPPPRGRRCPIETTGTSTQLPTMRGVESWDRDNGRVSAIASGQVVSGQSRGTASAQRAGRRSRNAVTPSRASGRPMTR